MAEPESSEDPPANRWNQKSGGKVFTWLCCGVAFLIVLFFLASPKEGKPPIRQASDIPPPDPAPPLSQSPVTPAAAPMAKAGPKFIQSDSTNIWDPSRSINYWWEEVPEDAKLISVDTGDRSNIAREDYAGAESCRECHAENYREWSSHPHRWMNAKATEETLKGDFSGRQSIKYLGGVGRFVMEEGIPKMILEREEIFWKYRIHRTIGSRFFQYYVGVVEEERGIGLASDDESWTTDSVLPFGYWLENQEWVPTVRVSRGADSDHSTPDPYLKGVFMNYDKDCSECHTTLSFDNWMVKRIGSERFASFTPYHLNVHLGNLLQSAHPDRVPPERPLAEYSYQDIGRIIGWERSNHPVSERLSMGITCEGCHLGSAEHATKSTRTKGAALPSFFPVSPDFFTVATNKAELTRRSAVNVNFICAKCHSSDRPPYANGTHTWNSTEFADAANGHCYHPGKAAARSMEVLTCISCHDPHQKIGVKWTRTATEDDQSCIRCHEQFRTPAAQAAHSHHSAGSAGSRCMNCHMPKINEGLQDMVRTHRIQSPVDRLMIENNQPNACNLCHLDKSIDWTLEHVASWYPASSKFDSSKIAANYPDRSGALGLAWLKSPFHATRLCAGEALALRQPRDSLGSLLDLLIHDDKLINRQFVQQRLKQSIDLDLKSMGYQFYMMPGQRRKTIDDLRDRILKEFGMKSLTEAKR